MYRIKIGDIEIEQLPDAPAPMPTFVIESAPQSLDSAILERDRKIAQLSQNLQEFRDLALQACKEVNAPEGSTIATAFKMMKEKLDATERASRIYQENEAAWTEANLALRNEIAKRSARRIKRK